MIWCDTINSKLIAYNPVSEILRIVLNVTSGTVDQSCRVAVSKDRLYWTNKYNGVNHVGLYKNMSVSDITETSIRSLLRPDSISYVHSDEGTYMK